MDIYATREELKSRQKNIFDLKLNVAYYARVSTDKEEQKTSIEHQWTFFEQLISDVKNWTLVDGYIDEGISGITVTLIFRISDNIGNHMAVNPSPFIISVSTFP